MRFVFAPPCCSEKNALPDAQGVFVCGGLARVTCGVHRFGKVCVVAPRTRTRTSTAPHPHPRRSRDELIALARERYPAPAPAPYRTLLVLLPDECDSFASALTIILVQDKVAPAR